RRFGCEIRNADGRDLSVIAVVFFDRADRMRAGLPGARQRVGGIDAARAAARAPAAPAAPYFLRRCRPCLTAGFLHPPMIPWVVAVQARGAHAGSEILPSASSGNASLCATSHRLFSGSAK